ncbi:putative pre-mRNA-splicing factor PRP46-like, partial [Apostichopus japonicus]
YGQQGETGLILSCSLDCSIKLWALKSGHLLKSIYTFNGIISMSYIRGRRLTVTGYTGGKIELWDILSGESIFSIIGHGEAVTALMVSEDKITTASADGMIKVWELRETKLHPIFVSENVKPELPRMKLISRKIHTVVEKENVIYYGDNGLNVKVLDWRRGVVHKIRNHKEDNAYGFVDSIHVTSPSSYLICSGYDLDLGNGYLNIFSLEQEKYLATLMDDNVSRIFTMATSTTHEGGTRLVTGGAELKVWDVLPSNHRTKDKVVAAFYNQAFSRRVFDSEDESADEDSTDGEGRTMIRGSRDGQEVI